MQSHFARVDGASRGGHILAYLQRALDSTSGQVACVEVGLARAVEGFARDS